MPIPYKDDADLPSGLILIKTFVRGRSFSSNPETEVVEGSSSSSYFYQVVPGTEMKTSPHNEQLKVQMQASTQDLTTRQVLAPLITSL